MKRDLLIQTGYELADVGRTLSWDALGAFLRYIGPDSALAGEINPEAARWSSRIKTNELLADIYDELAVMNANLVAIGTRRRQKPPDPYPRPGQKKKKKNIGSGALPHDELVKWVEERRENARNARGRTGDSNYSPDNAGGSKNNKERAD